MRTYATGANRRRFLLVIIFIILISRQGKTGSGPLPLNYCSNFYFSAFVQRLQYNNMYFMHLRTLSVIHFAIQAVVRTLGLHTEPTLWRLLNIHKVCDNLRMMSLNKLKSVNLLSHYNLYRFVQWIQPTINHSTSHKFHLRYHFWLLHLFSFNNLQIFVLCKRALNTRHEMSRFNFI